MCVQELIESNHYDQSLLDSLEPVSQLFDEFKQIAKEVGYNHPSYVFNPKASGYIKPMRNK